MQTPADEGQQKPDQQTGRIIQLGQSDDGSTAKVQIGDRLIIELESNPSTGFSWTAQPGTDPGLLALKASEFLSVADRNAEQPPVVGRGGVARFTYQVTAAGKTTIGLDYRRPWEKDVPPIKSFHVDVEVQ